MNRRALGYALLGLCAYVVFLLITFPAARAYAKVAAGMPALRLYGVEGSVWRGGADSASIGGQRYERVRWTLHPWTLLLGRIEFGIGFEGEARGRLDLALGADGGITARNVSVRIPVEHVDTLFRQIPARLAGELDMQLDHVTWRKGVLSEAGGNILWRGAATTSPVRSQWGDLLLTLNNDANGVKGILKDVGGPVRADGLVRIEADGRYTLAGWIAVRDPRQTVLVDGIRLIGPAGADGRVQLHYSGNL